MRAEFALEAQVGDPRGCALNAPRRAPQLDMRPRDRAEDSNLLLCRSRELAGGGSAIRRYRHAYVYEPAEFEQIDR